MRNLFMSLIVALMTVLVFAPGAPAQGGQRGAAAAPPAPPHDPHDLSGVFMIRHPTGFEGMSEDHPPRTPWGEAKFRSTVTARPSKDRPVGTLPAYGNDPIMKCDPYGVPRILFWNTPMEFIQLPGRTLQFFERSHKWRTIWTDGRTKPVDSNSPNEPELRWQGYSAGRWEGDTFIVDTTGFDDRAWLDQYGNIYSDEMKFQERYRRLDRDTIELKMTLTDPKTYTQPWVSETKTFRSVPNWEIGEDLCIPSEEELFNKLIRDPAAGVTK